MQSNFPNITELIRSGNDPGDRKTKSKHIDDIEPVVFLTDINHLNRDAIRLWADLFPAVHVVSHTELPEDFMQKSTAGDKFRRHRYTFGENRSSVWNRILKEVSSSWALFLEDDEVVHLPGLTSGSKRNLKHWMPVLIQWQEDNMLRQCYHIRLVANTGEDIFEGKQLPDCTSYIAGNEITLNEEPVFIFRKSSPFSGLDPDEELSVPNPSPQVYLAMGAQNFREGKYVHAAAQYRKLLKSAELLPYDRLAAVNGLAGTLAEQYKWAQAIEMAVKSIKMQPRQRFPYLLLFRIHQLAKRWKEAHEILSRYYHRKDELSAANFDKVLPEEETLVQLADMAFRAGLREESYSYCKKLYLLRGGNVESEFLKRLLLFSIEQSDYRQSMKYFIELFSGRFPDQLDDTYEKMLFEFLALFMKNGWYAFAAGKYQQLLEHNPDNETYMRRWLVALSKSKDIDRAQKVIARMRLRKKTG